MTLAPRLMPFATALAALLLTACAAEKEPTPIFADPSATPTPSAEGALEKDPHRSPRAAIRRWNHLSNTMQSGDTAAWRAFAPDCQPCDALTKRIEDIYANGGYVKTEGQTIQSIERESVHKLATVYLVEVHSGPTELRASQAEAVEFLDGGAATFRLHLQRKREKWSVVNYTQVAR